MSDISYSTTTNGLRRDTVERNYLQRPPFASYAATIDGPRTVSTYDRSETDGRLLIGNCVVDPAERSITTLDGVVTYVEPRPLRVLLRLARIPGHLVTRRQLLDEIWYPGAACDSALTRAVSILRRQLGDTDRPPRFIRTIHKQGYSLLQPVQRVTEETDLVDCTPKSVSADVVERKTSPTDFVNPPGFFRELKRRRVFRVAGAYAVAGWVIIQVGETTFAPLGVPEWCLAVLVISVILGFPMATALAWAVQLTPKGAVLEMPVAKFDASQSRTARAHFLYLLLGLLAVVSGVFAYTVAGGSDSNVATAAECSEGDQVPPFAHTGIDKSEPDRIVSPAIGSVIAIDIGDES